MTDHNDPIEAARAQAMLYHLCDDPYCMRAKCHIAKQDVDALIAVVEREKAASMPCYNRPEGCSGSDGLSSWTVEPPCPSCEARRCAAVL